MDESPFPYHGPLLPDDVAGRDEMASELSLRLTDHQPTALLAPRRYGKTSLVRHSLHRLEEAGVASAVTIDMFGVSSYADFAARLDRALVGVRGRFRPVVDTVAAGLSVRLGVVSVDLRRAAPPSVEPVVAVHALLDVLTASSRRSPTVVAFDEFSDVARVDGLDALLRTHLQDHYRTMGLVFAGSSPSMMRELFSARSRPFFSQAEIMELGPLDELAVVERVHRGFASTRRSAGPLAMRIWGVGRGHPQRTMQLADAAWRRTPAGGEASEDTWASALAAVRDATDAHFAALYGELHGSQGSVLRAIARTGVAFSGSESRFLGLSNSSVTLAREHLVRDGHLGRAADSALVIVDPLFEDWLLRTFP